MIRLILFIIACYFISISAFGQEALTGIEINQKIQYNLSTYGKPGLKSNIKLTLPFFDDFSEHGIYPNPNRWADNDVFINNDYPVFPVTAGVATFDALDENGVLHPNAGNNRFRADYLTSQTIRLDSVFSSVPKALTPADSIYLSFYFQPEGLGFAPAEGDSLVLEFFVDMQNDSLNHWVKVWSTPGMTLNEFFAMHNQYFKRVMIPIKDTMFLKQGFRFRFYNIASIRYPSAPSHQSNRDQWNLDYVYLDHNRSYNDRYYRDIAFANKPSSFLKKYQSMPYNQFIQNFVMEMRDTLQIRISNLNNTTTTGSYRYLVTRSTGTQVSNYESGTHVLQPQSQAGFVSHPAMARPPVNFAFPVNEPNPVFNITHILRSHDNYTPGSNDTIIYQQVFSDYYAYDDGTAEAGYGLTFAGGNIAYRFSLNKPDTLAAVRIFFNRTLNNANQKYFHIRIWSELGGKPGNLIQEELFFRVEYGDGLNGFYNYDLEDPVFIENSLFPGLVYYIGIEQTTADLLNIGFDRNNNNKHNIFYACGNDWCNTMFDGSLMIRPVLGTKGPTGISRDIQVHAPLQVFPNPARSGYLNIDHTENQWLSNSNYHIMNISGNVLQEGPVSKQIDISTLPSGVYMLHVFRNDRSTTTRFVVIN